MSSAISSWARSQCSISEWGLVSLHFCVASETGIGWRMITTNAESGNSACRKRIRIRLGGDFSISIGR